jgi:chemotaxis protein CheX
MGQAVPDKTHELNGTFGIGVDPVLLEAAIAGTCSGLEMAEIVPEPIGASRRNHSRHAVTVMVGLVGHHSGNLALNVSDLVMKHMASRLLGEPVGELNESTIDAILEVGNMIAGGIKGRLLGSGYALSHISLPSLVVGQSYNMVYARGIQSVTVEFEVPGLPFDTFNDRFFSTTVSLLRGTGRASG